MRSPLSYVGLFIGAIFFAFSLTPSLLPRPFLVQGLLSGVSFAVGYGLGVALVALWNYLQLPLIQGQYYFSSLKFSWWHKVRIIRPRPKGADLIHSIVLHY